MNSLMNRFATQNSAEATPGNVDDFVLKTVAETSKQATTNGFATFALGLVGAGLIAIAPNVSDGVKAQFIGFALGGTTFGGLILGRQGTGTLDKLSQTRQATPQQPTQDNPGVF